MPLIDIQSLDVTFRASGKPVRAVRGVSLQITEGEAYGIVGESGSGKSTLARVVAGLVGGATGTARLGDAELAASVDERPRDLVRRVQMVFQNPDSTLNPSHSIGFALIRPLKKFLAKENHIAFAAKAGSSLVKPSISRSNTWPQPSAL